MASKKEKVAELLNKLQENLNRTDVRCDERVLLDKSIDFRPLTTNGIMTFNDKVGSAYLGYWVKGLNGTNWAIKIEKEPRYKEVNGEKVSVIPDEFYIELLCEKMASACGMKTINSQVFKYSKDTDLYCIMSEDYRRPGFIAIGGREIVLDDYLYYLNDTGFFEEEYGVKSFMDVPDDKFFVNSLPIIYQALRYRYDNRASTPNESFTPKKSNSIVDSTYFELVKRYVFSYLTLQLDYHLDNWEILDDGHSPYLSSMYDMEKAMKDDFYDKNYNTSMRFSTDGSISFDEDFRLFLSASPENVALVERMLYMLTPQDVAKYMKSYTKNDIVYPPGLQKRILEDYSHHFINIEHMLDQVKNHKNDDGLKL